MTRKFGEAVAKSSQIVTSSSRNVHQEWRALLCTIKDFLLNREPVEPDWSSGPYTGHEGVEIILYSRDLCPYIVDGQLLPVYTLNWTVTLIFRGLVAVRFEERNHLDESFDAVVPAARD